MIPGIEEYYQLIADEMVNELPESWREARIETVFYPDCFDCVGEFVSESGEQESFDVSDAACQAFFDLREKFKHAGQRVWGQALFQIHEDGTFNVKWGYDNCDENGDTISDPKK